LAMFDPPAWVVMVPKAYVDMLRRKAVAVARRDRKRGGLYFVQEAMQSIHQAFCASDGIDPYDGQPMDPRLLGAYDNAASKTGGQLYKRRFARLPTVDHVNAEPTPEFQIVSWQTNDAKGDMTPEEFRDYCRRVASRAAPN
jgi:hypothetical protein